MSLNTNPLRASAKASPSELPDKSSGSDNGCSNTYPNQIRTRNGLEGLSEAERTSIVARLWSKVEKSDGCWLWTGSVTGHHATIKHGRITLPRVNGRQPHLYAHRVSWEIAYGPIQNGLFVCHHCDVPRCVRPEHLFLGTQDDNLKDAATKGRLGGPRVRKLTPAERLAIFHMPERRGVVVELAVHYGVSKSCISLTRKGRFSGAPKRLAQPIRSGLQQSSRAFDCAGLSFQPVPFVQVVVRGEVW